MLFDKYDVELTLTREMLGTNPFNPHILDTHIIQKQRKLISEKGSKTNAEINKYLDQLQITEERSQEELDNLFAKLEKLIGYELSEDERKLAIEGKLEKLRETFAELDLTGTTVFLHDEKTDRPCISDHMIYGFLKAATDAIAKTLAKKKATMLHSAAYTQSVINQHVRCEQRFIPFDRDTKKNEDGTTYFLQRSLRAQTAQGPRISLAKSEVVEAGAKLRFTLKVMKKSPLNEKILRTLFEYGEIVGLGQWRNAGNGMFSFELKNLNN